MKALKELIKIELSLWNGSIIYGKRIDQIAEHIALAIKSKYKKKKGK